MLLLHHKIHFQLGGAVPDEAEVPVDMLEEVLDAFNRHDLDAIMGFFTDDCSFDMPRGTDPWGRRLMVKPRFAKAWRVALPASPMFATTRTGISSPGTEACRNGG